MNTNTISVEEVKDLIKKEAYFHDGWDNYNLVESVIHSTKEASKLIDQFNHYDLPASAKVGKSWNLPDWYINGNNNPEAPHFSFSYCEFTAYIKAVEKTDNPNILKVEYWVYRSNPAHCSGYYHYWDKGTAMVDISTHRRWNVA